MQKVVLSAFPKQGKPDAFAGKIVEKRLAACVNIIPAARSIYRWKGKVVKDEEVILIIKTSTDRLEELFDFIKNEHPYEVPEAISLKIHKGLENYLTWIEDSTNPAPKH